LFLDQQIRMEPETLRPERVNNTPVVSRIRIKRPIGHCVINAEEIHVVGPSDKYLLKSAVAI